MYHIYKNNIIFEKVIQELDFLHHTGITINHEGNEKQIYFHLSLVLGDNLGLNAMLGFTQNFRGKCCRMCYADHSMFSIIFKESDCILREVKNYEAEVRAVQDGGKAAIKSTGVTEYCVFNKLPSYHVRENISVDPMHDILGGIAQYDMVLLIHHFINEEKIITLEHLNTRIWGFSYDTTNNKVPEIPASCFDSKKLILSSAEMLSLIKYFGLLIGDKVAVHDQYYQLYILLNKIIDIFIRHNNHHKYLHHYSEAVIEDYLTLKNNLFPGSAKYKYHVMVHYPRISRLMGPPWRMSSMRFESKHQTGKAISKGTTCRVNICHTIAIKHQLVQSHQFLAQTFNPRNSNVILNLGPYFESKFNNFPGFPHFCNTFPVNINSEDCKVKFIQYITYYSRKILKNNIILLFDNEGNEVIHSILCIFEYMSNVYFVTRKFLYTNFVEHFQSNRIYDNLSFVYCCIKFDENITNLRVGCLHKGYNGYLYCTLRGD
jgi:hypothetical protein